jgi:hypothetical protein
MKRNFMMTKTMTLFATVLLSGVMAQASASSVLGTWTGSLAYTDSEGHSASCITENTIAQNGTVLTFRQVLTGDCQWDATATMELQGENLMQDGTQIGTLTDAGMDFSHYMTDKGDDYSASLKMNADGTAQFDDNTVYANADGYSDSLSGSMAKAKSRLSAKSPAQNPHFRLK